MENENGLSPSLEDYLETILILERKNHVARVKDIAVSLSVRMPSVTGALKALKSRNLVEHEKNAPITLTPRGFHLARKVFLKHTILVDFFREGLGLTGGHAEEQACKVEHSIDQETAKRFRNLTLWIRSRTDGAQAPGVVEPAQ